MDQSKERSHGVDPCEAVRAAQLEAGGVRPSHLKNGESVIVETDNYMYRISKEDGRWFVESGHPMIKSNNLVVGIKSIDPTTGCGIDDWIGKGMALSLTTPYGVGIITKVVMSAIVCGNGYEVSVWD